MNNITALSVVLFLISLSSLPSLSSSSSLNLTETVFDILDRYNLPRGLLPDAINTYTFNPSSGRLVVRLRPTVCTFNRGQTSWRYETPLQIDLSRDRMDLRRGSKLGTVAAALEPPYTNRRAVTAFWRRDIVNAQGGTMDTLWVYPTSNYRIFHTAPFRRVLRCNTNTNTDVM